MQVKRFVCLVLIGIMLLIPCSVFAHPGRTDSKGGHYNRKTGTYHYHNGGSNSDSYDYSSPHYSPLPPVVNPTPNPLWSTNTYPTYPAYTYTPVYTAAPTISVIPVALEFNDMQPIPTNTPQPISTIQSLEKCVASVFSTGNDVRVRSEPNTSCKTLSYLYKGESVTLIANDGYWCAISTSKGISGYVRSDLLSLEK